MIDENSAFDLNADLEDLDRQFAKLQPLIPPVPSVSEDTLPDKTLDSASESDPDDFPSFEEYKKSAPKPTFKDVLSYRSELLDDAQKKFEAVLNRKGKGGEPTYGSTMIEGSTVQEWYDALNKLDRSKVSIEDIDYISAIADQAHQTMKEGRATFFSKSRGGILQDSLNRSRYKSANMALSTIYGMREPTKENVEMLKALQQVYAEREQYLNPKEIQSMYDIRLKDGVGTAARDIAKWAMEVTGDNSVHMATIMALSTLTGGTAALAGASSAATAGAAASGAAIGGMLLNTGEAIGDQMEEDRLHRGFALLQGAGYTAAEMLGGAELKAAKTIVGGGFRRSARQMAKGALKESRKQAIREGFVLTGKQAAKEAFIMSLKEGGEEVVQNNITRGVRWLQTGKYLGPEEHGFKDWLLNDLEEFASAFVSSLSTGATSQTYGMARNRSAVKSARQVLSKAAIEGYAKSMSEMIGSYSEDASIATMHPYDQTVIANVLMNNVREANIQKAISAIDKMEENGWQQFNPETGEMEAMSAEEQQEQRDARGRLVQTLEKSQRAKAAAFETMSDDAQAVVSAYETNFAKESFDDIPDSIESQLNVKSLKDESTRPLYDIDGRTVLGTIHRDGSTGIGMIVYNNGNIEVYNDQGLSMPITDRGTFYVEDFKGDKGATLEAAVRFAHDLSRYNQYRRSVNDQKAQAVEVMVREAAPGAKVVITEGVHSLDEATKAKVLGAMRAQGVRKFNGFYDQSDNTIYMNLNELNSPMDVALTLHHEDFHGGFKAYIDSMSVEQMEKEGLIGGLDERIAIAKADPRNEGASEQELAELANDKRWITNTFLLDLDESLARRYEGANISPIGVTDRLANGVRSFARNRLGFKLKMSDNEVNILLDKIMAYRDRADDAGVTTLTDEGTDEGSDYSASQERRQDFFDRARANWERADQAVAAMETEEDSPAPAPAPEADEVPAPTPAPAPDITLEGEEDTSRQEIRKLVTDPETVLQERSEAELEAMLADIDEAVEVNRITPKRAVQLTKEIGAEQKRRAVEYEQGRRGEATDSKDVTKGWKAVTNKTKKPIRGRYAVLPMKGGDIEIITSSDPRHDKNLQNRDDRETSKRGRQQIEKAAHEGAKPDRLFDSETPLMGAPILWKTKIRDEATGEMKDAYMLLAGHGRYNIINRSRQVGTSGRYDGFVDSAAEKLGVDTSDGQQYGLFRVLEDATYEEARRVADESNIIPDDVMLERTPVERAIDDGNKLIQSGLFKSYMPDKEGNVRAKSNESFLQQFVRDIASDVDYTPHDGVGFAPEIEARVRNAMLFAILGEDNETNRRLISLMIDRMETLGMARQRDGLLAAAKSLMHLKNVNEGAMDIVGQIGEALALVASYKQAKRDGRLKSGDTFGEYAMQTDMLGGDVTDASFAAQAIAEAIADPASVKHVNDIFEFYAENAKNYVPQGQDLLAELTADNRTATEAQLDYLNNAIRKAEDERQARRGERSKSKADNRGGEESGSRSADAAARQIEAAEAERADAGRARDAVETETEVRPDLTLDTLTPEQQDAEDARLAEQQRKREERDEIKAKQEAPLEAGLGDTTEVLPGMEGTTDIPLLDGTAQRGAEGGEVRFRVVSDPKLISRLENGKKVKAYRAMQIVDGKLYPPMAAKVNGKWINPTDLNAWLEAEEFPQNAFEKNGRWYFKLDKGNGDSIEARYNPYFHSSLSPLNDQFTSASKRPNLVTVEVEIPLEDIESGYKADKAKDAVGEHVWKTGPVAAQLPASKARKVILSRYNKVVRIVPDSEVAEKIATLLEGEGISIPENVVTPSLKDELVKRRVNVAPADGRSRSLRASNATVTPPDIRFRRAVTPEQDAEYMSAVEKGDRGGDNLVELLRKTKKDERDKAVAAWLERNPETAKRLEKMVEEAAKNSTYLSDSDYQGNSAFNGAAPSTNEYYGNKSKAIEAWENGEFEGDWSLADTIDRGIDNGELFRRIDAQEYRRANLNGKESISNLRKAVNGSKKLTMYRSVPGDIAESKLRNGDWITPSKSYAIENAAVHGWGNNYRIIEQEVSTENIWWDGNDINEWGYDDGKQYVYKNTKNNIKLLDPITYDDDGKVIPLSERFNEASDDIRFRKQTETPEFKRWFGDSKVVDADGKPLMVYHGVKDADMRVENGAVVFAPKFDVFDTKGRTEPGAWFSPDPKVAAKYGTPIPFYLKAVAPVREEGPLTAAPENADAVYRMRGKGDSIAQAWEIAVFRPDQIKSATDNRGTFDPDNPDIRFRRAVTPEQDAEYLAAVERGDMETAQRMVDVAASSSRYLWHAYHGTNREFTTFEKSRRGENTAANSAKMGFFFSPSRAVAESYANMRRKNPRLAQMDEAIESVVEKSRKYKFKDIPQELFDEADRIQAERDKLEIEIRTNPDQFVGEGAKVYDVYLQMRNPLTVYPERHVYQENLFADSMQDAITGGHDGMVMVGVDDSVNLTGIIGFDNKLVSNVYAVFDPTQIKSADPVTYDDAGNVIPLSQRFNEASDDIRFRSTEPTQTSLFPPTSSGKPYYLNKAYMADFMRRQGFTATVPDGVQTDQSVIDEAWRTRQANPNAADDIIRLKRANKKYTLTPVEHAVLVMEMPALEAGLQEANETLYRLRDNPSDPEFQAAARTHSILAIRASEIDEVQSTAGTEAGRQLRIRRLGIDDKFSRAALWGSAMRAKGYRKVSDAEMEEIRQAIERVIQAGETADEADKRRLGVKPSDGLTPEGRRLRARQTTAKDIARERGVTPASWLGRARGELLNTLSENGGVILDPYDTEATIQHVARSVLKANPELVNDSEAFGRELFRETAKLLNGAMPGMTQQIVEDIYYSPAEVSEPAQKLFEDNLRKAQQIEQLQQEITELEEKGGDPDPEALKEAREKIAEYQAKVKLQEQRIAIEKERAAALAMTPQGRRNQVGINNKATAKMNEARTLLGRLAFRAEERGAPRREVTPEARAAVIQAGSALIMQGMDAGSAEWIAAIRELGVSERMYTDEQLRSDIVPAASKDAIAEMKSIEAAPAPRPVEGSPVRQVIDALMQEQIANGVRDLQEAVGNVRKILSTEYDENMTYEEVRDEFSRFNDEVKPAPDHESVAAVIARLRSEARSDANIERVLAGLPPLRRTEPSKQDATQREKRATLTRLMKELGIRADDPRTQLRTPLDAATQALRNRIEDLERALKSGRAIIKDSIPLTYDDEYLSLRERKEALEKLYNEMESVKADRAERAEQILLKQLEQRKQAAKQRLELAHKGEFPEAVKRQKNVIQSEVIDRLRADIKAIETEIAKLQEEMRPDINENKRKAKWKASQERSIARYQAKMENKDFARRPKDVRVLSKEEYALYRKKIKAQAEYMRQLARWEFKEKNKMHQGIEMATYTWELVKNINASYDWSAIGRQGLMGALSHPLLARKAFMDMARATVDPQKSQAQYEELIATPEMQRLMREGGLFLADPDPESAMVSEEIRQRKRRGLLKIPDKNVVSRSIALVADLGQAGLDASDRAYVTYLNSLRANIALAMFRNGGLDVMKATEGQLKAVSFYVNAMSGRGDASMLPNGFMEGMSDIFWSPRLQLGRIQTLFGAPVISAAFNNETWAVKAIGKEYFRSAVGFAVLGILAGMLASIFNDDDDPREEITLDWRTSKFGKVRVGDRYIDLTGGMGQYVVLLGKSITGERLNKYGKAIRIRGEDKGYGESWYNEFAKMMRNKSHPVGGMAIDLIEGESMIGEPTRNAKYLAKNMFPLGLKEMVETAVEDGIQPGLMVGVFELLGLSASQYGEDLYKFYERDFVNMNKLFEEAKLIEDRIQLTEQAPFLRKRARLTNLRKQINRLERSVKQMKKDEADEEKITRVEEKIENLKRDFGVIMLESKLDAMP